MLRTYLDTYQTTRASIRIHEKSAVFKMNSILRAVVSALAALVAKVDTVIARSRKTCFNMQQRFGWIDFLKIFNGTCQPAGAAAGTIFMYRS